MHPSFPVLCLFLQAAAVLVHAQQAQNPSPMVEHTRAHPRLEKAAPEGRRVPLSQGRLFIPKALESIKSMPLFIHFHGGASLPEVAAVKAGGTASLAVQIGSGSSVYAKAFSVRGSFEKLLAEAEEKSGTSFAPVTLTAWSAGCGAIREILRDPANDARIAKTIFIDGIHASYTDGKPGPRESEIETANLAPIARFARLAMAGKKQMLITHSEIFPGTYASTTETADWLVRELGLKRVAVLKWGPMKTQQLSEARHGGFTLLGFAGNSAPDHVDQLHALPDFLARLPDSPEK